MTKTHIVARQLGLAEGLAEGSEKALFKWLVACLLFAKPIQQNIAWQAYKVIVEEHQYDTARKLAACSKAKLVGLLGDAHYVRYDNSTAERLIKLGKKLVNEYDGNVTTLWQQSSDAQAFADRLLAFAGVGPKAVDIFMRDAAPFLFPETVAC
jgi:endonuclease III